MSTGTQAQKFIVVFKDNVTSDDITKYVNELTEAGGTLKERYDTGAGILNGFSATIPESFLLSLQSLQGSIVESIEPDGVVTIQ